MSPLELWRVAQHEEILTPAEVEAWDWFEHLTPADVTPDLRARLSPAEITLLNHATRSTAA